MSKIQTVAVSTQWNPRFQDDAVLALTDLVKVLGLKASQEGVDPDWSTFEVAIQKDSIDIQTFADEEYEMELTSTAYGVVSGVQKNG